MRLLEPDVDASRARSDALKVTIIGKENFDFVNKIFQTLTAFTVRTLHRENLPEAHRWHFGTFLPQFLS